MASLFADTPPEAVPAGRMIRAERIGLVFALALGAYLRLRSVGPALYFGDELHTLHEIHEGLIHVLTHFNETGSGMALPLAQLLLAKLFGEGHWSMRAPAYLPALALLLLVVPRLRGPLGPAAAVGTTLLLAIQPLLIFYAHFARAYSAVALLCFLILADLLDRLESPRPRSLPWALALCTGLAPWVHPTALAFVLPVYIGALVAMWGEARPRREIGQLLGALAGGGILCLVLHAPAWASLRFFVASKTTAEYYAPFSPIDVATLLAGSPPAAWIATACVALAAIALVASRGWRAAPLILGVVGPPMVLAIVRPYGDPYAYARYVLPCVLPACAMLAFGIDAALAHLHLALDLGECQRRRLTVVLATGLAILTLSVGPNGFAVVSWGPHANTYLEMRPLAAFDEPPASPPSFYRELARLPAAERARLRIIEAPALQTRTRHLYRAYYGLHGVQTLLAPFPGEFPSIPPGPYVSLLWSDLATRADADYLVLHRDIAREVKRYWDEIYAPGGHASETPQDAAFLARHARFGGSLPRAPADLVRRLRLQLGEPYLADSDVLVWRLR